MAKTESKVTTLDDEQMEIPVASAAVVEAAKPSNGAGTAGDEMSGKFSIVTVHPTGDELGKTAVDVQLNGYLYQLPRSVPCKVPNEVLEILTNAVVTTYALVGGEMVAQHTPRFPFNAVPAP